MDVVRRPDGAHASTLPPVCCRLLALPSELQQEVLWAGILQSASTSHALACTSKQHRAQFHAHARKLRLAPLHPDSLVRNCASLTPAPALPAGTSLRAYLTHLTLQWASFDEALSPPLDGLPCLSHLDLTCSSFASSRVLGDLLAPVAGTVTHLVLRDICTTNATEGEEPSLELCPTMASRLQRAQHLDAYSSGLRVSEAAVAALAAASTSLKSFAMCDATKEHRWPYSKLTR
jgi:hypothetical protein